LSLSKQLLAFVLCLVVANCVFWAVAFLPLIAANNGSPELWSELSHGFVLFSFFSVPIIGLMGVTVGVLLLHLLRHFHRSRSILAMGTAGLGGGAGAGAFIGTLISTGWRDAVPVAVAAAVAGSCAALIWTLMVERDAEFG
jgi:hypothetical protein